MSEHNYAELQPGVRAYIRRGAGPRRDPSNCEWVEVIAPPEHRQGEGWRVRVRTIRPRKGAAAPVPIGHEREVPPSRLVPLRGREGAIAAMEAIAVRVLLLAREVTQPEEVETVTPDWKAWKAHLIVCADCTAGKECAEGRAILGPNHGHDDAPWFFDKAPDTEPRISDGGGYAPPFP